LNLAQTLHREVMTLKLYTENTMFRTAVVAAVVLFAACGGDGQKGTDSGVMGEGQDKTSPVLSKTTPSAGAVDVALRPTIELEFSENMDSTSVSIVTVPALAFGASTAASPNRFVFAASADASPSTAYSVTVSGKDVAGNALTGIATFSFTTKASDVKDTVNPKLLSSMPDNNAAGLARCDVPIVLKFSEAMDTAGVDASLEIIGMTNRTLTWNADSTELTIKAVGCLEYGAKVQVIVGANARDVAGNGLNTQPTLNFTVVRLLEAVIEPRREWSGNIHQDVRGYGLQNNEVMAGYSYSAPSQLVSANYAISRGFMTFVLSDLPSTAKVTKASLQLTKRYQAGEPFSVLGSLQLEHVSFGSRLIEEDFNTNVVPTCGGPVVPAGCVAKSSMTLATNGVDYSTSWDVTNFVVDDFVNRATKGDLTQMRIRFERDSTPTTKSVTHRLGFHLFDQDNGIIPPKLTVTYEVP
jgi:hypothetical protein